MCFVIMCGCYDYWPLPVWVLTCGTVYVSPDAAGCTFDTLHGHLPTVCCLDSIRP